MNDQQRRRLDHLFRAQRGECHWCGCKCVQWSEPQGTPPNNAATLDHIFDRDHPLRTLNTEHQRHVMACVACNDCHAGRLRPGDPRRKNEIPDDVSGVTIPIDPDTGLESE